MEWILIISSIIFILVLLGLFCAGRRGGRRGDKKHFFPMTEVDGFCVVEFDSKDHREIHLFMDEEARSYFMRDAAILRDSIGMASFLSPTWGGSDLSEVSLSPAPFRWCPAFVLAASSQGEETRPLKAYVKEIVDEEQHHEYTVSVGGTCESLISNLLEPIAALSLEEPEYALKLRESTLEVKRESRGFWRRLFGRQALVSREQVSVNMLLRVRLLESPVGKLETEEKTRAEFAAEPEAV